MDGVPRARRQPHFQDAEKQRLRGTCPRAVCEGYHSLRIDTPLKEDRLVTGGKPTLRRIDGFVTAALADMHERLQPYYSEIGRPGNVVAFRKQA
jgi:hypothetical protein